MGAKCEGSQTTNFSDDGVYCPSVWGCPEHRALRIRNPSRQTCFCRFHMHRLTTVWEAGGRSEFFDTAALIGRRFCVLRNRRTGTLDDRVSLNPAHTCKDPCRRLPPRSALPLVVFVGTLCDHKLLKRLPQDLAVVRVFANEQGPGRVVSSSDTHSCDSHRMGLSMHAAN